MCQTIFLSKLLGFFITILTVFILTNKKKFALLATQVLASLPVLMVSGCCSVLLGLYVVLTHNLWTLDSKLVVTLVGWIILLQGILRIFSPAFFIEGTKNFIEKERFYLIAWIWFLLGIYLLYTGFTI